MNRVFKLGCHLAKTYQTSLFARNHINAVLTGFINRRNINAQAAMPPDLSRVYLPKRTVPEEVLTFKARTYFASDTCTPYPNVHGIHISEFKVVLSVRVDDLALSKIEEKKLRSLAGLRYNEKTRILRLQSGIFPSRVENKKYLVYILESLLEQARNPDLQLEEPKRPIAPHHAIIKMKF